MIRDITRIYLNLYILLKNIYFGNYYKSKYHKQPYKIMKLRYKAIGKCQAKTRKRALRSNLHFLTVRERWKWIIVTIEIAQFPLFLFFNEPAINKCGVRTLTAEPPPHPIQASTLLVGPPFPPLQAHVLYG